MLSRAGLGSRTEARRWIAEGRVAVNGRKIQTPDTWVDPDRDRVTFDGRPLRAARRIYLLLYKPKGYLTTYKDPEGRADGLRPLDRRAKSGFSRPAAWTRTPAASPDLTNDTAFGDYITVPESHVPKTYLVKASDASHR